LEFSKNLTHCEALIKVNDTLTMTGDQTAMINKLLTPSACLHLGNIPNSLTYENIPSGGFIGCMSDLKVHGRNVYIYKDAEDGYEISECSSLACLSNPCKNGASCISSGEKWRCRCKNGFLGNMCVNYQYGNEIHVYMVVLVFRLAVKFTCVCAHTANTDTFART
ncbi:protein eyes shut-like, partial [Sitophilus oryzae]|uniref:Protein eyes shut-like n=1 Tax=Sitophilus oryzae TaxID=7048 RepID=A0A6J2X1P5_SITOR